MEELYYIVCRSPHGSDYAMFWRANAAGYTRQLHMAGKYTKEQAELECPRKGVSSRGEDFMVECCVIDERSVRVIPFEDAIQFDPGRRK